MTKCKIDHIRSYLSFLVLFLNLLVSSVNAQTKQYLVFDPYYRAEQNVWMKYTDNSNVFYHHIAVLAEKCLLQREDTVAGLNSLEKWKSYLKGLQTTLDKGISIFKKTPLNIRITGTLDRANFRVEKIVFESLPGFYVSGCLFIPIKGEKPFPAILYAVGHSPNSFRRELYQQNILNLVNKGFVVFTYDPIGQGERIQYSDTLKNASVLKGTTQEHSYAGAQCLLTGHSISDYFLWDGVRAIDFLFTRPEVDTLRIGMTGISGGGTQTAILSAVDKRIYAAAPECFITSYKRLFESIGPQDAEQNLYQGLKLGIEHSDLLSLRAPKPTMIISTTQDFFSIQGARETFTEAKKVFDAYGKPENLSIVEADGPHGTTKDNNENMYRFFQKNLNLPGNSMDEDLKFFTQAELKVTLTGQVSTSYQSKTVFDLNQEWATQLIKKKEVKSPQQLTENHDFLLNKIMDLSGYDSTRSIQSTVFTGKIERVNYKIEKYFIESKDFNYAIPFVFIKPYTNEKRPLILYLSASGKDDLLSNEVEFTDYINKGYSILVPDLIGTGELKSTYFKGDSYINGYSFNLLFGINLVGRSIAGIQSSDLDVLFKYIRTRNDINTNNITSIVKQELCSSYLHFAVFHNTITKSILVNPLISYEDITQTKYYQTRYLLTAVPGAIEYYDLPVLESMLNPSKLTIINPVNAKGDAVSQQLLDDKLSFLLESYKSRSAENQLQIKRVKDEEILHLIRTSLPQIQTLTTDAKPDIIQNLISPPETETDTSITVLWNKPIEYKNVTGYDVYVNGSYIGYSKITNYTINALKPNRSYSISIVSKDTEGKKSESSKPITAQTKTHGKVFNILDYGAKPDSGIVNTKAIQRAIQACSVGGIVLVPSGTFISGALFLKSNMTLFIAKGGVLKGSTHREDYMPLIKTRFEGWEFQAYASLITAGRLDETGSYNVRNISIRGEGKITGGGALLGKDMADNNSNGTRGRGRLICLMNCENVNIQGLTIEESPCWTIHYTYSKNVTCNELKINSITSKTPNGDGIDPDSSINSYIFNCTFSTYDDCIAIKSGKNPQGNKVGKPCKNVYISNCNFVQGHSLAIGSEISGGIKNVQVIDCELGNLWFGLQVKTTEKRGGYVEDLLVKDCSLQLINIVTSLPYNNDGESAQTLTKLKNFEFTNLNITNAKTDQPVIYLEGFSDTVNYAKNIRFKDIKLPNGSQVFIKHARDVMFENIRTTDGLNPEYNISENLNVRN